MCTRPIKDCNLDNCSKDFLVWPSLSPSWAILKTHIIEKIWSHTTFDIQVCNLCHYSKSCYFFHYQITMLPPSPLLSSSFVKKKRGAIRSNPLLKSGMDYKFSFKWHFSKQVVQKWHISKFPHIILEKDFTRLTFSGLLRDVPKLVWCSFGEEKNTSKKEEKERREALWEISYWEWTRFLL